MVTAIRKPQNPATKRQLWYLHILTGKDTRKLNITVAEASDMIDKARTQTKPAATDKVCVPAPESVIILPPPQAPAQPVNTAWVCPTMPLALPQECEMTRIQRVVADSNIKYHHTWQSSTSGYNTRRKPAWQSMRIGNQTITLDPELPNLYKLIAEVVRTQTDKPRQATYHRYANGYESPQAHPLIVSKKWLAEAEEKRYPEATIEVTVDGKSISLNGDYKQGMIEDFIKPYTKTVRAGKKMMTILKDQHIENMGGGVYVAVSEK